MLQRTVPAILGLALWAMSAGPGWALSLVPGEALEAPFSVTANVADTLTFNLVSVDAVGVSTMTVELYDGATLLGSVSGVSVTGVAAFVDAGSLWTSSNQASADLSTLRDGSTTGRIVVLPDFAPATALDASVSEFTSFQVGHGTGLNSLDPIAGVLTVGEGFVVPEPGAAWLLAGAAALRMRRRLR
jgi:hypothetical protein